MTIGSSGIGHRMSRLVGRPEIETAAIWWGDRMFSPNPPGGPDPTGDLMRDWWRLQLVVPRPPEMLVERFRAALRGLLAALCERTWDDERPERGEAVRTLYTDYGPDATLRAALEYSGVGSSNLILPLKTCMWVSPESVVVRHGYHAPKQTLFPPRSDASK